MATAIIDETCEQFVGQWRRLVSTTNWDKGRIIHQWRQALIEAGAPPSEYSDESWSRTVGNVTPQHVGRLRRVFERFGPLRDGFPGLFWSHFQAALDWHDAEMWLEGALQSGWSIAEMRSQRAEALGQAPGEAESQPPAEPWDEDADSVDPSYDLHADPGDIQPVRAAYDDAYDGAAYAESREMAAPQDELGEQADASGYASRTPSRSEVEPRRPLADLPSLPGDVAEAFEAYKLCILRHKLAHWQEISREDLLASLDALRELALAPADA